MKNSFATKDQLRLNGQSFYFYNLKKLPHADRLARLPFSLKILLENLLRFEDESAVQRRDIETLLQWDPKQPAVSEIAFTPSRVILQDFTGVPAVVDLAAMREAMQHLGGDPAKINPLSPVELVIDHSVMVDHFGSSQALSKNTSIEIKRNIERYSFLRWGQQAFDNFKVVPPGTGIVHQVNLEYLARTVFSETRTDGQWVYPDTVVGTDSHTTMINGLGVLGWGVGGIEAEAAMLGQPITMLIPEVVGFEITGKLPEGATATDLVLLVTQMLRQKGVVGKFVEFFGEGLAELPLADRATIANMAPEYGATCGIFPIDQETLNFLSLTGRRPDHIALVEAYAKAQGLFHEKNHTPAEYSDILSLDLSQVVPCVAGPKRPQDRIPLKTVKPTYEKILQLSLKDRTDYIKDDMAINEGAHILEGRAVFKTDGEFYLQDGAVVIAAITSCTNTSNPAVMMAAGLIAKAAHERGLKTKPWVKTSLAPGSQVVTDYLTQSGLMPFLDALGFNLVGYGCTTCIGNSGPLPKNVSKAIAEGNLAVAAVLSGNRNFEGRIHPEVKHAFLASPPLVVIYALAGTMNIDLYTEPLGHDAKGQPVFLKDLWPSQAVIQKTMRDTIQPQMFADRYQHVFDGDHEWKSLSVTASQRFTFDEHSTYIKNPPYFDGMTRQIPPIQSIQRARILALLGDSVTTDHISPAGSIAPHSPAGEYLLAHGVAVEDFNSYGSRRGNHDVMVRGTFANIRLQNTLARGKEGGYTTHFPSQKLLSIYDASLQYQQDNVPLIVMAGQEYGTGSSRDWAAKGTYLLGIKAVIAQSFERIHRSNLIGMGVLPLQFLDGENASQLSLTGEETYTILFDSLAPQSRLVVQVTDAHNVQRTFTVTVRIDTPKELEYYRHGGILHYVLRQLAHVG